MKDGQVTFSVMNYVMCRRHRELHREQRNVSAYRSMLTPRALGTPSPLTSDRCTVFMERDLNHYLCQGYSKEELLAATLDFDPRQLPIQSSPSQQDRQRDLLSRRDGQKRSAGCGFRTETAEADLCVQILSPDRGAWHLFASEGKTRTQSEFRGICFYRESPIVSEEICDLCKNHCKLKKMAAGDRKRHMGLPVWTRRIQHPAQDHQPIGV